MKQWSNEQVKFLLDNKNIMSFREIAGHLGKTYEAVLAKNQKLMRKVEDKYEIYRNDENTKKEISRRYLELYEELRHLPGQRDIKDKRKEDNTFPAYTKIIKYFEGLPDLAYYSNIDINSYKLNYDLNDLYEYAKQFSGVAGIYQFKNVLTEKVYVGQAKDLLDRIRDGYLTKLPIGKCHNILLQRSWDLYGKEFFEISILEFCDISNLDEREKYWGDLTRCADNKYGFNISPFTSGGNNRVMSDEEKKKRSIAMAGKNNPMFGKTHSPEARKKISDSQIEPVYQFDKNGVFLKRYNSSQEASNQTNIPIYSINQSKSGKIGLNKNGYFWFSEEDYLSGDIPEIISALLKKHRGNMIPIIQLDLNGNKINEFENINKAEKITGVHNIWVAMTTGGKSGGYYWIRGNN